VTGEASFTPESAAALGSCKLLQNLVTLAVRHDNA